MRVYIGQPGVIFDSPVPPDAFPDGLNRFRTGSLRDIVRDEMSKHPIERFRDVEVSVEREMKDGTPCYLRIRFGRADSRFFSEAHLENEHDLKMFEEDSRKRGETYFELISALDKREKML